MGECIKLSTRSLSHSLSVQIERARERFIYTYVFPHYNRFFDGLVGDSDYEHHQSFDSHVRAGLRSDRVPADAVDIGKCRGFSKASPKRCCFAVSEDEGEAHSHINTSIFLFDGFAVS